MDSANLNSQCVVHTASETPSQASADDFINAIDAAALFKLPLAWFVDHRLRAHYQIPHYVLGRSIRYRRSELQCWVANHGVRV